MNNEMYYGEKKESILLQLFFGGLLLGFALSVMVCAIIIGNMVF